MIRVQYPEDFKQSIVQKMLSPGGPSLMELSRRHDIAYHNLARWRRKYGKRIVMKNSDSKSKEKKWSAEEMLETIVKTSTMNEHELGEFIRKNGLHSVEIEQWRNKFISSLNEDAQRPKGRPRKDPLIYELRNREKSLEKELRRKDKALAEMSARIVLLKKSHLIFGVREDEE